MIHTILVKSVHFGVHGEVKHVSNPFKFPDACISVLFCYRPAGSRDLYYTESGDDTASVADSITTQESTHAGQ